MKHIQHTVMAAQYSLAGLRRLLDETAAQAELLFFVMLLVLFAAVGADITAYGVLTLLFLITFALEALNTAVEVLVDHLTNDFAEFARQAKDLGSFAVFCSLTSMVLYSLYVLYMNL